MSLVELVIAMGIISVAILATIAALVSNIGLTDTNRELSLAINAARTQVETLQDYPEFSQVFTDYRGPMSYFEVAGLIPISGAPYGNTGQICFPGATQASPNTLLENVTDTNLGMPRDLNGDGVIDGNNHASDYTILPVTVRVEWQTKTGPAMYQLHTILVAK